MAEETLSQATLTSTVQGFTPINQCFDSAALSEVVATTAQPGSGANKGKKRHRKGSATQDPPKGSHSRPPKKAKQRPSKSQDISNVFNVTKPHTQGDQGCCEPRKDSSPGAPKGTEVPALDSHDTDPLEGLGDSISPATYQAAESSMLCGLGTFELEETRLIPDEHSNLDFSNFPSSTDADCENGLSAGGSISPSAGMGTMQPTAGQSTSTSKTSAFGLDGIPTQTVAGSAGQVPCSSGIFLGAQHAEAMDAEPAAVVALLPFLERCLSDCHPDDWNMADAGEPHPQNQFEGRRGERSPPQSDNYDIDVPGCDDLLLAATKDECSSTDMDQDEYELSMLMSEFINSQGEVPGDTSEVFTAPPELLFSSDIDLFESFDAPDINNISSDISLVESSSPYLPSLLHLQKDSEPYDDVSIKPVDFDQAFPSEDIYNDDDMEAVLAECQSPPSAQ
ncbi:MAG: hypothetical protein Q9211_006923, partial [Gyalolechia sp. 1 TL-2023]